MALYRFSLSIITRTHGQSACAAAAYISGTKLTNEYDGITHDYRKKQNVEYSEVLLPENAPDAYKDSTVLWNEIELMEKSSNAQLARSIQLSLPIELMEGKSREEYNQKYIELARDFLQHTFVDDGMVCLFAYHNPPMMNSKKQPIDINGRVTHDPAEYVYINPHIHAQLSMRPIDPNGKWAPKSQKLYVCEKDGLQQTLSAAALRESEGWEKIWKYSTQEGQTVWHTKTYALGHPEERLVLASNSPKSVKVKDPIVARWDDRETLEEWRTTWETHLNQALRAEGLDVRVDHRSYERQGLNYIPQINESKAVIMEEKRRLEEYQRKVDAGEDAVLIHTDIRTQNILIQQHNEGIRIRAVLNKLQNQLNKLLDPVLVRVLDVVKTIAVAIEYLRAEIILLRSRVMTAKETKWTADQKIREYKDYINTTPSIDSQVLQRQSESLKQQIESAKGPFKSRLRQALSEKLDEVQRHISLAQDNQKIMDDVERRIERLTDASEQVKASMEKMEQHISQKTVEYRSLISEAESKDFEQISRERLQIRPDIQREILGEKITSTLQSQIEKFDSEMHGQAIPLSPGISSASVKIGFTN